MKRSHILADNKTTALPHHYIFVDTETNEKQEGDYHYHTLKLGSACYVGIRNNGQRNTEVWKAFTDTKDFWSFVEEHAYKDRRLYLYAHNQHFDFFVLDGFKSLVKTGWKIHRRYINSNIFILVVKKGSRTIVILDSGNILKIKLSSIAETMGMKKFDVDFNTSTDEQLQIYCRQDVKILKEWLLMYREFVKENDLGVYRYTMASQTLQAFKHRFMTEEIVIHNRDAVYKLERESYKGGRTECFFIGKKKGPKFVMYDVNSMYPYVLNKFRYPIKLKQWGMKCSIDYLKAMLQHHLCIAEVRFKISEPAIMIREHKMIFPIGTMTSTLTTPELSYVIEHGQILEVKKWAIYEGRLLFKKYINFFYQLKKDAKSNGKDIEYLMAKLYMNSLYGKFGQRAYIEKKIGTCDPTDNFIEDIVDASTGQNCIYSHIMGEIFMSQGQKEAYDSFPAIASHVTAYARMYLWSLIKLVGRRNVLYCDTDSLLIKKSSEMALHPFIHDSRLGALSREFETDSIILRGCKDYLIGNKSRIKGIRKDAVQISLNVYRQTQFYKTRSALRLGIDDCAIVKDVTKHLRRIYDKGLVLPSGVVRPFICK